MRKTDGFMLIDILMAIVIVSFGLLGVAGIIANGLKNNQGSYARSQAIWLADDIIDRMRANRSIAQGAGLPYNLAIGTNPSGTGVPYDDLSAWRGTLASTIPSGTGSVTVNAATRRVVVIVQWDDSRATKGQQVQQFRVETQL